jgi:hypothetical protein
MARRLAVLMLLTLLNCSASPELDAGTGGGTGGGGTGGGGTGGGQATLDAGRMEGELCVAQTDCATGLRCVARATASGTPNVCSACQMAGTFCGDGGRCLSVAQPSGVTVTCSFGGPGEPCSAPGDCRSGFCDSTVTAGGVTTACR